MTHILKYHLANNLQDGAGNPLSHVSYCFDKCLKNKAEAHLLDEEKLCTCKI